MKQFAFLIVRFLTQILQVAEYMFAKSLNMPCVLLRTDFRAGGDAPGDGEPRSGHPAV